MGEKGEKNQTRKRDSPQVNTHSLIPYSPFTFLIYLHVSELLTPTIPCAGFSCLNSNSCGFRRGEKPSISIISFIHHCDRGSASSPHSFPSLTLVFLPPSIAHFYFLSSSAQTSHDGLANWLMPEGGFSVEYVCWIVCGEGTRKRQFAEQRVGGNRRYNIPVRYWG